MFSHFFKIFFRSTLKNGAYSLINVSGLTVALACSIFTLLWVMDEITFDDFHEAKEKIYAIRTNHSYPDGNVVTGWSSSGRLAEALKELPEVEESCRTTFRSRVLFQLKDKSFYEEGIYADADVFKIFTISFVEGNHLHALADNKSIVISERLAEKYFGKEFAIGKVIRLDDKLDATVTAVFKDLPDNSSLNFDFIIPYSVYARNDNYNEEWGAWTGGLTYVKLHEPSDVESANKKITTLITKPKIWPRWGDNVDLFLFPLSDWRLYDNFQKGKQEGGRISFVKAFSIVGAFILVIACINFMNLSTARSVSRAREVGVRKVVGAGRQSLIRQFIGESLLISFIALSFSLIIVHLLLPVFNDLTGKHIRMDYTNPVISVSLIAITVSTGIMAGMYPAFLLSSLRAIHVLKGKLAGLSGTGVRKALVVFQFGLSVILIVTAMIVHKQVDYMRNKNLGFDKENVLYFNASENLRGNFENFRNEALRNPLITFVSQAAANPIEINQGLELGENAWPGKTKEDNVIFQWLHCDYDFLPSLGFTLVAGRNFSRDVIADSSNFIITEEAAKRMKLENPVGQVLTVDRTGQIIGVVKDFHSTGLKNAIQPVIISMRPESTNNIFIRYEPGRLQDALKYVQTIYKKFEPDFPLHISFMDEPFGRLYQTEILIGKLSTYLTAIAIFISCLGLFGLASFTAEKRSKEIGVRKVMGATVSQMIMLLCRDFVALVIIALVAGLPIAWWIGKTFAGMYAFHADLSISLFVIAALTMLLIALITVSFQSAKAALTNPVNSLRSE